MVLALFFLVFHLISLRFFAYIILPAARKLPASGLIVPYLEHFCVVQACFLVKCIIDVKVSGRGLVDRWIALYHRVLRFWWLVQAVIRGILEASTDIATDIRTSHLGFIYTRTGLVEFPISPSTSAIVSSPRTSAFRAPAVKDVTVTSLAMISINDTPIKDIVSSDSPSSLTSVRCNNAPTNDALAPIEVFSLSVPRAEFPLRAHPAAVSTVPLRPKSKSKPKLLSKSRSLHRNRRSSIIGNIGNTTVPSIKRSKKISARGLASSHRIHWAGVDRYRSLVEKLRRFEVEGGFDER